MRLLDEHAEALEADLAHYYPGTDLLDVWRGRMSWRRLRVLVNGLPATGTALAREMHGAEAIWTPAEWLLARIADHVADGVWAFYESKRDPHKTPNPLPRPEPVQTPRDADEADDDEPERITPKGKRAASAAQTMAMLQGALG